MYEIYVQFIK